MIPLRDTIPSRRPPLVNWALIVLCGVGFAAELMAGPGLETLIHTYALTPARFLALQQKLGPTDPSVWIPFVTSMFLHAGWLHFLGNMLYLWIFGDAVEARLGHAGYAAFYLAGGVAAGAVHVASDPASVVPTVGASGAIAAVMGAYFLLYPRARVTTLVFLGFWVQMVRIPAVVYLAVWFALQLFSGVSSNAAADTGVAWWAHIGGFAFGAAVVIGLQSGLLRRRAA